MNDLEKMSVMAKEGQDIRMSATVTECNRVKQGGKITFGIDANSFDVAVNSLAGLDTHYLVMYVINKEQFDALHNIDYCSRIKSL